MAEEVEIKTESKSFRLPVDVIETLQRWGTESEISPTLALVRCVRASLEDESRLQDKSEEDVLQADDVLQMFRPRDRDSLHRGFLNLIAAANIDPIYVQSAFSTAYREFQQALPIFQEAEKMRVEFAARREQNLRPLSYTKKGPSLS